MLDRQEDHADAVFAGRRQSETKLCAFAAEELVRDLNQNAGAVAGFRVASARAAMRQVDEDLNAFGDDFVRWLAVDVDNKANTAGVFLVARIVQSLLDR